MKAALLLIPFFGILSFIFTVCKRSCGKVIFSQTCVKNSVHGGGGVRGVSQHALGQIPPWQTPPIDTPSTGYYSGRYLSYWIAFLLNMWWLLQWTVCILLECILVKYVVRVKEMFNLGHYFL